MSDSEHTKSKVEDEEEEDYLIEEEDEWDPEEERKLGQTKPTPSPGDGGRVFYETLLQQRPDSYIALKYCIEYGILPGEKVEKAYKEYLKLKEEKKHIKLVSSPVKATSNNKRSNDDDEEDSNKKSKKKSSNIKIKIVNDDEYDDGGNGGGMNWEGVGTKTLKKREGVNR